jgi:hypothetical protein
MRGGMLLSSASADVALDAGADEPAEALCEGGSCHGNHGFTRGAPSPVIERITSRWQLSPLRSSSEGHMNSINE